MNPPPVPPPGAAAAGPPAVQLDAAGNLAEDISCRRCSYNLRSLSLMGKCPECGTAVGRSIHGDLLRFSDPEWVQRLASGINWIVTAIVVGLLAGFLLGFIAAILQTIFSSRTLLVLLPGFQYLIGLVSVIGYWMVTTPDPASVGKDQPAGARSLVRLTAVGTYLLTPIQTLFQLLGSWIALIPGAIGGLLGVVFAFAVFVYGRQLALRIPDEKTARECRIVMWGLAITSIFGVVVGLITLAGMPGALPTMPAAPATTSSAPAGTAQGMAAPGPGGTGTVTATWSTTTTTVPGTAAGFVGAMCFMSIGYVVFGIWSLRILLRMRKALNAAAEQARATWAGESGAAGPTKARGMTP